MEGLIRSCSGELYTGQLCESCDNHALVHDQSCTPLHVQWNPDTLGPEKGVPIIEVSLFQRLENTQTQYLDRQSVSCVLISGVS